MEHDGAEARAVATPEVLDLEHARKQRDAGVTARHARALDEERPFGATDDDLSAVSEGQDVESLVPLAHEVHLIERGARRLDL